MNRRLNAPIGVLLLVSAGLACSMLRPKRPLVWHLTLEINAPAPDRAAAMSQTIDVIKKRLDGLAVSNFEVKPQGDPASGRILVNLPDVADRDRLVGLITAGGKLELVAVISPPSPGPVQIYATNEEAIASLNSGGAIPLNRRVLPYGERTELNEPGRHKWLVVEAPAIVNGSDLRNAVAVQARGGASDDYEIQFSLNKAGAERFGAWTGAHVNEYLGVALNDEVKSIAFIKSQITDQGIISGRFTRSAAQDLALVLKSGALPARVFVVEETSDKSGKG